MGMDKNSETEEFIIALAGNPNVGKSTVFNALTGMNQHTGNWPGKTVSNAQGIHHYRGNDYILVDLPGTYSLMAHSAEEEIARDFILFGGADATIVVCDATCLERNLNLVLQVMEITPQVVVCVNLMDEAKKKNIVVDLEAIEKDLGVPVVGTSARSGKGLKEMMKKVEALCNGTIKPDPRKVHYQQTIEEAIAPLEQGLDDRLHGRLNSRWLSLRLLERDDAFIAKTGRYLGFDLMADKEVQDAVHAARKELGKQNITLEKLKDSIVSCIVFSAEAAVMGNISFQRNAGCAGCEGCGCCAGCSIHTDGAAASRDRKIDKILISKYTGIPIMIALLCVVLWLTITGSNYPSQWLADGLFWVQDRLTDFFLWLGSPDWVHGILVLGIYRVLAWVVSVMLPPMAIFFPLFTLLEDFGYLPRVAFNLDHQYKKAKACGKQALTMCMGFGCNSVGVIGCRIIDSPRERLIAIITNNFVPCNGRFPTLIAIISMFFVGTLGGAYESLLSTLMLAGVIILGILLTFAVSRFLSETLLKGEPSSFTLELPPYRTPQIGKVIVRSIFDRTLLVLGRAVTVAAPAGLIIWILANITVGDMSLLNHCSAFLDPFARLLGMDGVILLAFILGFPANEIVVPIMIMSYLSGGSIMELNSLGELKTLLVSNGWTWATAVSTLLFCLIHWPCSTTCLTIKKETGSLKWTALSVFIPTAIGITVCFLFTSAVHILDQLIL